MYRRGSGPSFHSPTNWPLALIRTGKRGVVFDTMQSETMNEAGTPADGRLYELDFQASFRPDWSMIRTGPESPFCSQQVAHKSRRSSRCR